MINFIAITYNSIPNGSHNEFSRAVIRYMDDGSVEYTCMGEVSEESLNAMIEAEGADIEGYVSTIS